MVVTVTFDAVYIVGVTSLGRKLCCTALSVSQVFLLLKKLVKQKGPSIASVLSESCRCFYCQCISYFKDLWNLLSFFFLDMQRKYFGNFVEFLVNVELICHFQ